MRKSIPEKTAKEAKPIFINAIKEMTIADGMAILRGTDTAATAILRKKPWINFMLLLNPKLRPVYQKFM